jgi:hypothetical protein
MKDCIYSTLWVRRFESAIIAIVSQWFKDLAKALTTWNIA